MGGGSVEGRLGWMSYMCATPRLRSCLSVEFGVKALDVAMRDIRWRLVYPLLLTSESKQCRMTQSTI